MKDDFLNLTPDKILNCAEGSGLGRATGRMLQLNSMENRVYEVELESGQSVVGKFYRAGRWPLEALLDEHEFLEDLAKNEVPAVTALKLDPNAEKEKGFTVKSETIGQTDDGLYFSIFPKVRGRAPDEITEPQAEQLGRLVARMHAVGIRKDAKHRPKLGIKSHGTDPLQGLLEGDWIAIEVRKRYEEAALFLFKKAEPLFKNVRLQRIHGDCHKGNFLFSGPAAFFLDFDDMVEGPVVQDLWLATPDVESRTAFLKGYETMNIFNHEELKLIEPLRALRIIHYSWWIAKRWNDPYFKRLFPEFTSYRYWASELENLEAILRSL